MKSVSSSSSASSAGFRFHTAPVVGVRVREHLLEVRFELLLKRLQTPYALPLGLCTGGACDKHPFHDRLKAEFELHRGAFRHSDDSLDPQIPGGVDRAGQALQRARTPPQLVCVEHKRVAVVEAGVQSHSCFRSSKLKGDATPGVPWAALIADVHTTEEPGYWTFRSRPNPVLMQCSAGARPVPVRGQRPCSYARSCSALIMVVSKRLVSSRAFAIGSRACACCCG